MIRFFRELKHCKPRPWVIKVAKWTPWMISYVVFSPLVLMGLSCMWFEWAMKDEVKE